MFAVFCHAIKAKYDLLVMFHFALMILLSAKCHLNFLAEHQNIF